MPLEEVKRKEFKIPLAEFQEYYKIPGKITSVNFYPSCPSDGTKKEIKPAVAVYVNLE